MVSIPAVARFFEKQYASKVATESCEIFSFVEDAIIPHFMRFLERIGTVPHKRCIVMSIVPELCSLLFMLMIDDDAAVPS